MQHGNEFLDLRCYKNEFECDDELVIKKIDETLKKLQKGDLKPLVGHPWVLYLLAHGSNDKTKSVNAETRELKKFLREVIVKRKLEWLD